MFAFSKARKNLRWLRKKKTIEGGKWKMMRMYVFFYALNIRRRKQHNREKKESIEKIMKGIFTITTQKKDNTNTHRECFLGLLLLVSLHTLH